MALHYTCSVVVVDVARRGMLEKIDEHMKIHADAGWRLVSATQRNVDMHVVEHYFYWEGITN
jgi:hypothetical protein